MTLVCKLCPWDKQSSSQVLTVEYTYDLAGRPTGIDYSDSTPHVIFILNRLGQLFDISDGVRTRTRGVTTDGRLLSESLKSISSSSGSTVISAHAYTFDALNRRTESVLEDGNKWRYQYDSMGQVVTGEKKHSSGAAIPGMKFGYAFDGIGNRNSATINGRTGTYTADVTNQYTERQVPGALDIRGRASTTARVTVNTESTQRLNEYFYKALTIDNSSAPQYPGVSVLAVKNHVGPNDEDLQSETTGHLYLAKTPEVFTHDAEGNLTTDGRWIYTWDGENRLIRQETIATVPTDAKRKLEFAYDAESRRVRKQTFTWNGSTWVLQKDLRFLYDGWNLVAELDAANTMQRNFVWGLDLSRTPQGAAGVGGLLAIREGTESHLPAFDGNGNVMALVKASDQSTSARYEYGPFGETLVVEENGISNPFRFSTKYLDSETGLFYYGFRYYNPVTGSWPSRDPIQERGGLNLYGFVGNDALDKWDLLGRLPQKFTGDAEFVGGAQAVVSAGATATTIPDPSPRFQAEGCGVKTSGELKVTINYKGTETDFNGAKDAVGTSLKDHEKEHVEIYRKHWNGFVDDLQWMKEGKDGWFKVGCYGKAVLTAKYALALYDYAFASANKENCNLDQTHYLDNWGFLSNPANYAYKNAHNTECSGVDAELAAAKAKYETARNAMSTYICP